MSATIILLPGVQAPSTGPDPPQSGREAVFRALVCLTEAEKYQDPDRFLELLYQQGYLVMRKIDGT